MQHNRLFLVALLLTISSITTAIVCVYARHESRKLFTKLQYLISERDALELEWSQLQIEQSTWSTHSRVEQNARMKMKMRNPTPDEIQIVAP